LIKLFRGKKLHYNAQHILTNIYSNLWALSSGIDAVEAADERFIMAVLIIAACDEKLCFSKRQ
jgi:hypothetical protein